MRKYKVVKPYRRNPSPVISEADEIETIKADILTFPSGCLVLGVEDDELNSFVVKAYGAGQWISVEEVP